MSTSPSRGSFNSTSSKVSGSLTFLKRAALNVLGREGDILTDGWILLTDFQLLRAVSGRVDVKWDAWYLSNNGGVNGSGRAWAMIRVPILAIHVPTSTTYSGILILLLLQRWNLVLPHHWVSADTDADMALI